MVSRPCGHLGDRLHDGVAVQRLAVGQRQQHAIVRLLEREQRAGSLPIGRMTALDYISNRIVPSPLATSAEDAETGLVSRPTSLQEGAPMYSGAIIW